MRTQLRSTLGWIGAIYAMQSSGFVVSLSSQLIQQLVSLYRIHRPSIRRRRQVGQGSHVRSCGGLQRLAPPPLSLSLSLQTFSLFLLLSNPPLTNLQYPQQCVHGRHPLPHFSFIISTTLKTQCPRFVLLIYA